MQKIYCNEHTKLAYSPLKWRSFIKFPNVLVWNEIQIHDMCFFAYVSGHVVCLRFAISNLEIFQKSTVEAYEILQQTSPATILQNATFYVWF